MKSLQKQCMCLYVSQLSNKRHRDAKVSPSTYTGGEEFQMQQYYFWIGLGKQTLFPMTEQ